MRIATLLFSLAVTACVGDRESARELELASAGTASARGRDEASCAVPLDMPTQLLGRLERRVLAGPPGYGESRGLDSRDTSWVVVLPEALPRCDLADESIDSARREVQLVSPPANVVELLGESIEVFGRLDRARLGWQRTPLIIYVDSIPAFRRVAARRQSIG